MAWGHVIKVTIGLRGTSWLRCSAGKLNIDRKPRVWYCKKIICLPARVRPANQRGCFHVKEILQWERKEWNPVATGSPSLLSASQVQGHANCKSLHGAATSAVNTHWVAGDIGWSASLFNHIGWTLSQKWFLESSCLNWLHIIDVFTNSSILFNKKKAQVE